MKRLKLLLAAIALLSTTTACNTSGDGVDPQKIEAELRTTLLEESEMCALSQKSTKLYDQSTEQIVYNNSRSLYMVSNMDNSTNYTLNIKGSLLLNNIINVDYTSNNIEGLGSGTLSMIVLKIDSSDKRYWLWDSELLVGFVIDFDI